jgi:hypothetical protein
MPVAMAGFVGALALSAFYLGVYRTAHRSLPVGFDTPWYVWRAAFVGARGIGPVGTSVRPGHPVLASILGSVSNLSALELGVVLAPVVAAVFALALGAFWVAGPDPGDRRSRSWSWVVPAAVGGTLVGATRLVGENVANLLVVVLVVVALAPMARGVEGSARGLPAAGLLLVAAGLVHWVFLAVFAVVLGLAAVLALPVSLADRRGGTPALRTESGVIAAAIGVAGVALVALVAGVLRAPFQSADARDDPSRFLPKLRSDLDRLYLPALLPVAAGGAWALTRSRPARSRSFSLRVLLAWTLVMAAGTLAAALTLSVPPHRLLALLVAVPGALALAAAVLWLAGWSRRRWGRLVAWSVATGGILLLAIPGWQGWYHHGPGVWIDGAGLQEAETASVYLRSIPAGQPAVILLDPHGRAGIISAALADRDIRLGLTPAQQEQVHFYVGELSGLLEGRPFQTSNPDLAAALQPYWEDVGTVLPARPPVLVLKAFAHRAFAEATGSTGGREIGAGVALVRGPAPAPATVITAPPIPRAFPGLRLAVAWAAVVLAALYAAGLGWTRVALGPGAPPAVIFGLAPAVGAGALILGGFVAAEAGVRLGGAGGVATFAVATAAGTLGAWLDRRRSARSVGAPGAAEPRT